MRQARSNLLVWAPSIPRTIPLFRAVPWLSGSCSRTYKEVILRPSDGEHSLSWPESVVLSILFIPQKETWRLTRIQLVLNRRCGGAGVLKDEQSI